MPVTLKDIAQHCGVAVSTVSNILNDHKDSYASERLKRAVKETARQMGYRKHYLSVSLRTRKTLSIGLCLDMVADETRRFFINTFVTAFNKIGYEVAINAHERSPHNAREALQFFNERYKDGIVLFTDFLRDIGPQRDELISTINTLDSKILGIGSEFKGTLPCLDIDRSWAFDHAFDRFEQQGHQKIAVVYKTPQEFRSSFVRLNDPRYIHLDNIFTIEQFCERWPDIYGANPTISALFFRTDAIAIAALKFFAQQGISVPRELAVCSFDHFQFSQFTSPPLTTYDINFSQLGELACQTLVDWIEDRSALAPDFYQTIRPKFIERHSHDAQLTPEVFS